jgi:hypothetical protein
MDFQFMLIAAVLAAVLAVAIASFLFSNRDKGFTSSQMLMAGFVWLVMMIVAYIYQRVF